MESHFEEIFQGWLEKEEHNKNKSFLKKNKYWKKYFCVLRRYDGDENVYFQWFEKEEDWRKEFPKGSFSLFPKYAVYKRKMEKVKFVFEITNDDESHFFTATNEKTMDLWVIQFMMQTRVKAAMIESSFRVKGGEGKCLVRIGAKNLNCLLHIAEWGITLALERTHSVLSQWPLTTIRNYECTDDNEFVFEAGRKSPMGEGKYRFHTTNNEDNAIFDQLDRYTSLRAKRVQSSGGRSRRDSGDDDMEIAQAYGKLRWSVMLDGSTMNLGVIPAMPSEPQAIVQNDRPMYNNNQRSERNNSFQSTAVGDSYDRLDRMDSFNERERSLQTTDTSYSRLNCSNSERKGSRGTIRSPPINDSYDHLERGSSFHGSPTSPETRSRSFGSLEDRSRSQFFSHNTLSQENTSYNCLSRDRHSSLSSQKGFSNGRESYDKLDRSAMSVHGGTSMNSYDRLDNMQENVFEGQHHTTSPPTPTNNTKSSAYDTFGNRRDYVPKDYDSVNIPPAGSQAPLVVELPPPLPQKPSFMMQTEEENQPVADNSQVDSRNTTENTNGVESATNKTIAKVNMSVDPPNISPESLQEGAGGNAASHYQEMDEVSERDFETAEPRRRLNTHSSETDLRKMTSEASSTLDRSKRDTIHRSAPSLALYTIVRKTKSEKGKGGLSKTASTSKLDGFLKKISRISAKKGDKSSEEEAKRSYEKAPRKSKKFQLKLGSADSSSSLRRLVEDDSNMYAEINDNVNGGRNMERSESKRPLPELPPRSGSFDA